MTSADNLPEPGAHPGILKEPTDAIGAIRSKVSTRRLGWALFIIGFGWVFANAAISGVLISAKLAILSPTDKVFLLGLSTALAGIATTISLFFWGTVSDLTRSKFGRRTPWIVFGAVAGFVFIALMGIATTAPGYIAAYIGYSLVFNALCAAVLAIFADRIPRSKRGTTSAVYGGGQLIGGSVAGIVLSRFIDAPNPGYFIVGVVMIIGVAIFLLLAPDYSNKDQPRQKLDVRGLLAAFKFPRDAPDFYWAFFGRFVILLGVFAVQNFMLYILEDYIGLSSKDTANYIALASVGSLVGLVIGTFLSGPLSDRLGRRKAPIFAATLFFALALVIPLVWPVAIAMFLYATLSGLGLGAFLSVDTALMTEVIPAGDAAGKDLGLLNTANTVPQIIAPLMTSAIVGIGFGYAPVFVVAIVLVVIGAISIFKIRSVR